MGGDALPLSETEALKQELEQTRRRAERLEQSLVEAQRLATVGQLAGSMAHEFNNLLTLIIGRAEQALKYDDPDMRQKALEKSVEFGRRAADIVASLLGFATGRKDESELIAADALMDAAVRLVDWHLPKDGIQLVRQYETSAKVRVVPVRMEHVLLNLILNARKAMKPGGGTLTLSATLSETPGYVALKVQDTGCGIKPEHTAKIFEPFFTTAPNGETSEREGRGSGLGLPIARDLARQAGGEIHAKSTPAAGSTFTVLLPIVEEDV
jgi:signal transduction histidine kinase